MEPKKRASKKKRKPQPDLCGKSLYWLNHEGYLAGKVESTTLIHEAGKPVIYFKRDLFGAFDIIAVILDYEILRPVYGIQVTSYNHGSSHRVKMMKNPKLKQWLLAGQNAGLHLWDNTRDGGRSRWHLLWQPAIVNEEGEVEFGDYEELK